MVIRAIAPLRMSFAGGGTDLPGYYSRHPGAVLSSTIRRFARATVRARPAGVRVLEALNSGVRERLAVGHRGGGGDGRLAAARAAVARVYGAADTTAGFELAFESQAPRGSGLGGSSALIAAICAALLELQGQRPSREELAELVFAIEQEELGVACGRQDMYAVLFGGFNLIEFETGAVRVTPLHPDPSLIQALERRLLLCYTGRTRRSSPIIDRQKSCLAEGRRQTLDSLSRMYEMVFTLRDSLLAGRLDDFAALLDEGFWHKRRANPAVSDARIDDLYETARHNGCQGGKLLGAGGGGYLLLCCEEERKPAVRDALTALGGECAAVEFDREGLGVKVV